MKEIKSASEKKRTCFLCKPEHPMTIAIVSAVLSNLIFGTVIVVLGLCWQRHERAIESREKVAMEVLESCAAMEQRVWNYYGAVNAGENKEMLNDRWQKIQETDRKMISLTYLLLIYFDKGTPTMSAKLIAVKEFWTSIARRVSDGKISEQGINEEWKQFKVTTFVKFSDELVRSTID